MEVRTGGLIEGRTREAEEARHWGRGHGAAQCCGHCRVMAPKGSDGVVAWLWGLVLSADRHGSVVKDRLGVAAVVGGGDDAEHGSYTKDTARRRGLPTRNRTRLNGWSQSQTTARWQRWELGHGEGLTGSVVVFVA